MERFVDRDLTGAEFRECDLTGARLIGVVLQDAEIDGLVGNLVVNGVEVSGYVEAELDRRHPVRVLLRSERLGDLRRAHATLREHWATTVDLLDELPPGSERRRVDDEWSMVETLRHLVFVHDSWFRRCILGRTDAFTPMGLAIDAVPDQERQGIDRSADPTLPEVLEVRAVQAAELGEWLDGVDDAGLHQTAPVPEGPGWPPYARGRSVLQCLHTVLNEEFEHHGFCVRDLERLR